MFWFSDADFRDYVNVGGKRAGSASRKWCHTPVRVPHGSIPSVRQSAGLAQVSVADRHRGVVNGQRHGSPAGAFLVDWTFWYQLQPAPAQLQPCTEDHKYSSPLVSTDCQHFSQILKEFPSRRLGVCTWVVAFGSCVSQLSWKLQEIWGCLLLGAYRKVATQNWMVTSLMTSRDPMTS